MGVRAAIEFHNYLKIMLMMRAASTSKFSCHASNCQHVTIIPRIRSRFTLVMSTLDGEIDIFIRLHGHPRGDCFLSIT
jgi:hypothetical protein